MEGEIINVLPVGGEGLKVNEGVSIIDANGTVSRSGDEIAREIELRRSIKGKRGDGSRVVMKGTKGGGSGQVVEMDRVVGSAGGNNGARDSDGFDLREMGGIREERG